MQLPTFVPSLYDDALPCHHIITMLGLEFFGRLQAALGGQEIRVPERASCLTDDHRLVRALGRADATKLCEVIGGGEMIYIPRGERLHPRLSAVIREMNAGTGRQAIAAKLGVSARQVRRLKQQAANLAERASSTIAAQ